MKMKLHQLYGVLVFEILFCIYSVVGAANKSLICYYDNAAYRRPGDSRFTVQDIDPYLCTHMVYDRLYLDIERTPRIKDSIPFNKDKEKFIELKDKNPQLRLLIYLELTPGTWNTTHLKLMAKSSHVNIITRNVVSFLQRYQFDGIVLHFFPSKEEKLGFMNVINAIIQVFLPNGYFLALRGSISDMDINDRYDVPILRKNLDFIILHAYGLNTHEKNPKRGDHHSPLYKRPWDIKNNTADFVVSHWINNGFPPEKILLVIPLFGRSWMLSSDVSSPPAPAKGPGPPAIYTEIEGLMSYFEVCLTVVNEGWKVFQDPHKRMGPYAVSSDTENQIWVGYDDPDMAVVKTEYVLSKGLGGAAVWDVSMDDFRNKCGNGRFPMLTAIRKSLFPVMFPGITSTDIENLLFRQKVAFTFSLIVSLCSFITICYILYRLYNL